MLWYVKCHFLFLLVMIFGLLCRNELQHDAFHFIELLLNQTEFFHTPFVVLGATHALLVALALTFFDNVLLLIIDQGPPVIVEPRDYISHLLYGCRIFGPLFRWNCCICCGYQSQQIHHECELLQPDGWYETLAILRQPRSSGWLSEFMLGPPCQNAL